MLVLMCFSFGIVLLLIQVDSFPVLWSIRLDECSKLFLLLSVLVLILIFSLPQCGLFLTDSMCLSFLTVFTIAFVFVVESPVLFYVFFELSVIPLGYLLVVHGDYPERLLATSYLYLYTFLGSVPMFVAVLVLPICSVFELHGVSIYSPIISVLLLALLVKLPIFSLHMWLPKAHSQSPVLGSVLLAALALNLASYGLFRVMSSLSDLLLGYGMSVVFMACLGGMLLAAGVTSLQSDSKVFIAYSSVAHMGACACVALVGGVQSLIVVVVLSLLHAVVSSCYFLIAHVWSHVYGTRSLYLIKSFSSVHAWGLVVLVLLAIGNTATPPWLSYMSEIFFFSAILSHTAVWWLVVMLLLLLYLFVGIYTILLTAMTSYGSVPSQHVFAVSVSDSVSYLTVLSALTCFILHLNLL